MTRLKKIRIADIEEFDSVNVVEVLVKIGERVTVNQPLVTLESEKAIMDFPSPNAGVVQKVKAKKDERVRENDVLVTLEVTDEPPLSEQIPSESSPVTTRQPASNQETVRPTRQKSAPFLAPTKSNSAHASPGVYQYARELGVDLSKVQGSGRQRRITKQDVQRHVRVNMGEKVSSSKIVFTDETEAVALTRIQRLTAENMRAAWQDIPHVTHFDRADVTRLEQQRKQLAEDLKGIKLTSLAFVIKALVSTLKHFPRFNALYDPVSEQLLLKKGFHVGIAVDTPHGLLVPVMRDVDKKTITQTAVELVRLGDQAKNRKLAPQDMADAGMTISSLGNLGGRAFTPIINPPQVAILGLSKMIVRERPAATGRAQQKLLPLALSYDHRVINGADAARFCTHLKGLLEDIWKLAL